MLRVLSTTVLMTLLSACQVPCEEGAPAVAYVARSEGGRCSWFPDSGELCPQLTLEVLGSGDAGSGEGPRAVVETRVDALHAARVQAGQRVWVRTTPGGGVCLDTKALAGPPPTSE